MSDTDNFIDEVTELVRKDELYGYARKYGWIAVVAIVALVGGAAFNEVQKAKATSAAQAVGDGLLEALSEDDATARTQALNALSVDGPAEAVTGLMQAANLQEVADYAGAATILNALATNPDIPVVYQELAAFKAALLPHEDAELRRAALTELAQPGATFGPLAQEQLALLDIAAGETEAALVTLRAIAESANVSEGLRDRAQTLIVALGETIAAPASE